MSQDAVHGHAPETTVVHLDCSIHAGSGPLVLKQQ